MFGLDLGKYRTIVLSIALFLLFDLGVLVLNFVISSEIASDALNVNLAGRQRMLSQRTAKVALQIEDRVTIGRPYAGELKELQQSFSTFDRTLEAFAQGGETLSGAGNPIYVAAIDDEAAQAIVAQAKAVWTPYRAVIQAVLQKGAATPDEASAMARRAEGANLHLLKHMNDLTTRVEELAASKATMLRAVQVTGIGLATLNFMVILFHFIRHLRESDHAVERAHRETDNIMRTTQEGLFLLDADYRIGSQHSRALEGILGLENVAEQHFLDLLKPVVSEKTLATTREYIELLFKHDVKEKLVASLNPLNCLEINLARGPGETETRYLQFGFNRVIENGQVTHLLVTANDITRRIRLERELKATEERARDQMSMLVEILQADPAAMQNFMGAAADGLNHINQLLREQEAAHGPASDKVNAIFRVAHRLKGDAAALGLGRLADSFHGLEDVLSGLRERAQVTGEDFLAVTVKVKALYDELEMVGSAITRIAQIRGVVTVEPTRPQYDSTLATHSFVRQWQNFAGQIAERQGKSVELIYSGIDIDTLPPQLRDAVGSVVNQFIRNAVVHGIEPPHERQRHGKADTGRLSVYVSQREDGGVDLSFRDDGQGLSVRKIRQAAVRTGRLDADEAASWDDRQIAALIFEPGMSTREHADEDAGRGAGLDAVKDLVSRLGGHIRLGSTPGEYCHFRLSVAAPGPSAANEPQAASATAEETA